MRKPSRLWSIMVLGSCLVGCAATVGAGGSVSIPTNAASSCSDYCTSIGLALDAVVIMANNVGCVCRAAKPPSTAAPPQANPPPAPPPAASPPAAPSPAPAGSAGPTSSTDPDDSAAAAAAAAGGMAALLLEEQQRLQ